MFILTIHYGYDGFPNKPLSSNHGFRGKITLHPGSEVALIAFIQTW